MLFKTELASRTTGPRVQFHKAVLVFKSRTTLLSKKWVGHQSQQWWMYGIVAGNLFLLSKICLCLASIRAYRLYEIWPRCLNGRAFDHCYERALSDCLLPCCHDSESFLGSFIERKSFNLLDTDLNKSKVKRQKIYYFILHLNKKNSCMARFFSERNICRNICKNIVVSEKKFTDKKIQVKNSR